MRERVVEIGVSPEHDSGLGGWVKGVFYYVADASISDASSMPTSAPARSPRK